jgi:tetratricopeptide (TPR) repeat protein
MYKAQARTIRGWTLLDNCPAEESLAEMKAGLAEYELTHTELLRPQVLTLIAEGLAETGRLGDGLAELENALRFATRNGDVSYLAEVYRMKGELLLKRHRHNDGSPANDETVAQAKECFEESIKIAQEQNAKFWQLRSAVSLAQLYQSQDRRPQARTLVEQVLNEFTEGFETWDLQRARGLLNDLS